jgi:hypothetical protein
MRRLLKLWENHAPGAKKQAAQGEVLSGLVGEVLRGGG